MVVDNFVDATLENRLCLRFYKQSSGTWRDLHRWFANLLAWMPSQAYLDVTLWRGGIHIGPGYKKPDWHVPTCRDWRLRKHSRGLRMHAPTLHPTFGSQVFNIIDRGTVHI